VLWKGTPSAGVVSSRVAAADADTQRHSGIGLTDTSPVSIRQTIAIGDISQTVHELAAETGYVCPSRAYTWPKRALDLFGATIGLLVLSPLFLVIALIIKLDSPGPVFFTQTRVGQWGRTFRIYKFRSMTVGSGVNLTGKAHKRPDDPRVTRAGRLLRRLSLDELPQLLNVLRGEMSLVGPRPEILDLVLDRYDAWQFERFFVPQGITGWWQVKGRGQMIYQTTTYDIHYVRHASFALDLRILLLTAAAVVNMTGAF
jgi:lipopolysaccharide/colanic/teichoic acid biosynthesis glycosyltransferase